MIKKSLGGVQEGAEAGRAEAALEQLAGAGLPPEAARGGLARHAQPPQLGQDAGKVLERLAARLHAVRAVLLQAVDHAALQLVHLLDVVQRQVAL